MNRFDALALAAALFVAACNRRDDSTQLAPTASALASSTTDTIATAWHYRIDPKSSAHVDMPGLKEHIVGDATAGTGSLDVVPRDLASSRGLVRIDLSTFATHTFGNDDDATQTKHARTWLEVQMGDKTNEEMRWADFAIRSIDGASATDLTKVAPIKDGQDDVRTVTVTVHGEVLIHGHKLPKDDVVDALFHYPQGAAADAKPTRIEIKSKQPMHIVLKEHDVRPRDPAGQLLDWTTKLISKVAETADVTIALEATPAS
jgi:hypothetical protein